MIGRGLALISGDIWGWGVRGVSGIKGRVELLEDLVVLDLFNGVRKGGVNFGVRGLGECLETAIDVVKGFFVEVFGVDEAVTGAFHGGE